MFTALTATDELPALSLFALISAALLLKAPRQTLIGYVPAALVVAAAFFGTNYIAHESLRPPYMHRSETNPTDNWYDFQYTHNGRVIDSYWKHPVGIDKGQPSMAVYAFHALIGHHGIFSLTPIWLLAGSRHLAIGPPLRAARSSSLDRRGNGRLRDVLHLLRQTARPQLRWNDERLPLGLLVRAALAFGCSPGRRLACRVAMAASDRLRPADALRHLRQLPDLEPLDQSLANEFFHLYGLGEDLTEAEGYRTKNARSPRFAEEWWTCRRPAEVG